MPRKEFVRALSQKGIVCVLDEFKTSKCCPGCGSEMKDVETEHRIRQCTLSCNATSSSERGTGALCSLHMNGVRFTCDRDESATLNMMQCAYGAIHYGSRGTRRRPEFLCRNSELEHTCATGMRGRSVLAKSP